MNTTKEKVQSLLNQLPDDCSIEDIQYHLYVIEKVSRGLEAANAEGAITQEEVEERLSKWLIK
jgi:predicted transcriptional regulator